MTEVKGPIIGTVLLAGINPAGEPKYIDGTVLVAGLNANGKMEYLDPDNIGSGTGARLYACVQDQKAQNVNGGGFTQDAWRTRDLNTVQADSNDILSLAANQITLIAGIYVVHASAPAQGVNNHQIRLQDITNGITLITGTSSYANVGNIVGNRSFCHGQFTLTGSTVIELQHRCQSTNATNGLGVAVNFGIEVYSIIEFWREA